MSDPEKYSPFNIEMVGRIKEPSPPDDLKSLIIQLFDVKRFIDDKYPPGIFFDNVGEHEFRLVIMVDAAEIDNIDLNILKRILWVHDIPELITGEFIAPRKQDDKNLATQLETQELEAAGSLLEYEDVMRVKTFNSSVKYLKGDGDMEGVSKEGLIACVLDKIDGNMFFHYSMARWVNEGSGERVIPSRKAMEFTFKQRELFFKNLDKLPDGYADCVDTCKRLLDYQTGFIVNNWSKVPENKQPQIIKDQLKVYSSKKVKREVGELI